MQIRNLGSMAKSQTIGLTYAALRKECLDAVRQWPGCETVGGIQIIRDNTPGGFSVRVTLYGKANVRIADRAMVCVPQPRRLAHCLGTLLRSPFDFFDQGYCFVSEF